MVADVRQRMIDRLNSMKMQPCLDCGFIPEDSCQMDYDHVGGEKVGNLATMIRYGNWSKVEEEIAKCELVCSNCHRLRTKRRLTLRGVGSGSQAVS
jgi:hypothetical protein